MATAYGLEPVPGGPTFNAMADLGPEPVEIEHVHPPLEHSRRVAPPPNPNFSFPALVDAAPSPAPTNFSRTTARRPKSAIDSPTQSFHLDADATSQPTGREALPAFSFNPGADLPPSSPMSSPPVSPPSPRTAPSTHKPSKHGHRRGGSEFVGGRIREGNSIAVLSGSPTKAESGFASLNNAPPRRGHRRGVSSALSTNDLSLLPPPRHDFNFKGSSAPNSPTNFDIPALPPLPKEFMSTPSEPTTPAVDQPEPKAEIPDEAPLETGDSAQPKPAPRARVGFSDTLEYIPRPLSLVSTDTSSTITAKPGHGVSGSISSIVTCNVPNGRDSPASLSRSPSHADTSRPSTAGAILERTPTVQEGEMNVSPRRRNSIPALLDMAETDTIPSPEASPTKSKRWTFFGLDPFPSSLASPNKGRPHSSSSGDSATRVVSGTSSSDQSSESVNELQDSKDAKQVKKKSKRRKIVQGWAGSILPRKSKHHKSSKYTVRPPTPPASVLPPDEDEDDAMDIDSPSHLPAPTVTVTTSPDPSPAPRRTEDASAMIDLDAALGPFNTPLPDNPEWDAAQRAAGNAGRRRLHSAQGMRGFSGPGMHYHRRAESAPDLPPFDPGAASIHRFGSNSTMADVFEEDEEEDGGEGQSTSGTQSQSDRSSDGDTTPPAVPSDSVKETPRIMRRKSSGLSDKDQSSISSVRAQQSRTSLHENVIVEEPSNVLFHPNSTFGGSDASGSPRLSPRKTFGNKELPSFELGAPGAPHSVSMPVSPHSMSYASSPRSPMSADTQRLSTAPSSVHEDNSFQSLLLGEPGPEVRLSVDYDIPSLTSSNSTMTRDSNVHPHSRMSQPSLREPRPLSVSSAAFGRRRSSLVSLSRLISSSHGEPSKLSMEVTLDPEAENRKPRSKKKRFGRLVQFWRPKDGTSS